MREDKRFLRQCNVCRNYKQKEDLCRITRDYKSGEVILNIDNSSFGRSVYVCRNEECIKKFIKNKKSLRGIKSELNDEIKKGLENSTDMINLVEVQEDIKELAEFASEIWHEYWVDLLSGEQIDYMVNKFQSKNAIEQQIKEENYIYFYIEKNGEKTGYTGLSHKKDMLFLSKLYVKKEFRHIGIGTKTFEFIKDYAKSCNYDRIELTVNKGNKNTIEAYKKWGFQTIDAVVTDIGSGFVMDDYIMQYTI